MKAIFVSLALFAAACTDKTTYGDCVGVLEEEDPKLKYDISSWNIAMGIIGLELIFPPIIVFASSFKCPTGVR